MSNKTQETPIIQHVLIAMHGAQEDLAKVGMPKDGVNSFDKYQYRTIDGLYNLIAPILAKHRLLVVPNVLSCEQITRPTAKGGESIHTILRVRFTFMSAVDASTYVTETVGEAMDRGDKSINKALTAAFKYLMFTTFALPLVGTENDADSESHEIASPAPAPTLPQQANKASSKEVNPPYPDDKFEAYFPKWRETILNMPSAEEREQKARNLLETIRTRYTLSDAQTKKILNILEETQGE